MAKDGIHNEYSNVEGESVYGVLIARLFEVGVDGPAVILPKTMAGKTVQALTTVALTRADIGCEVALSFENGDPKRPIILGKLLRPEADPEPATEEAAPDTGPSGEVEVDVDGRPERLEITGKEEVVLRCGKASITLTKAGKVIIKGAYISSRSTGMNRIKGGSVHLN